MSDNDTDNYEMSNRGGHRPSNRWTNSDNDGLQPVHIYANAVDNERRRQQVLQLMLIFSMLFIMLTSPTQQSSPSSSSDPSSGGVAQAGTMSNEYASTLQRLLEDKKDDRYIYPTNASGIYRGDWTAPTVTTTINSTAQWQRAMATSANDKHSSTQRTRGKMFMQLRSLSIANVKNFEFIYGVIKLYGAGKGPTDLLFPLQGVSIPSRGVMTLLSTPSKSHVLFLQIPRGAASGKPVNSSESIYRGSSRRLSEESTVISKLSSVRESVRGESSFLSGDSLLFLQELRPPSNDEKEAGEITSSSRRRLTLSSNDSAIVSRIDVGDTGLKMFVVDIAMISVLPPATINSTMTRNGVDFYDRLSVGVVGEGLLPSNFKSLQSNVNAGRSSVNGLASSASSCQFSLDLNSMAIGESYGNSAKAQEAVESYVATILGGIRSSDCGFDFNVTSSTYHIKLDKLETKARDYSFMAIAVCMVQIALLILQLKHAQAPAVASKISIAGLCAHSLLDAALCVAHLLLCASIPKVFFGLFIWVSILKLFIFCVFEMRTVITIYQARYSHELQVEGWQGLRRRLASLHLRFYGVFFVMLMLFSLLYSRPAILIPIFYSVWVPQIVHNAVYDTRRALHPLYLIGLSISRLFIPLYFLWCPKNFLGLLIIKIPDTFIAGALLVVWTAVQVLLLVLQDKWGSRFFLPSRFQAHKYDYYRAVPTRAEDPSLDDAETGLTAADNIHSNHECVICYNDIHMAKGQYMVTPCEHVFHTECLKQWIEIKLECPVCRHVLEPCDD